MMDDITASELLLIRIVRENGKMAAAIARLRADLEAKNNDCAILKRQTERQAEAIQTLSHRINIAEGNNP